MTKYRFIDDYSEGAHAKIVEALITTNSEQLAPYGKDKYTELAQELIRKQCRNADVAVHFVTSGTLANITIAAATLRTHHSVIAAESGHIVANEAGAIEATGHQIIKVPCPDGKLTPDRVEAVLQSNSHYPHTTKPGAIYISNATEYGTVYDRDELQALARTCRSNGLLVWLDGARLGAAIAGPRHFEIADAADYCDIFWIGGTKAGALMGEAIVIPNDDIADDFAFNQKQRGALLSKGRVIGAQFARLFEDGLFFELANHSCAMAQQLSSAISGAGYELFAPTESNMVFAILPDTLIARLCGEFELYVWKRHDEYSSHVRLVASWSTDESRVHRFAQFVTET